MPLLQHFCVSTVPDKNGISGLYYNMLEIYHSGWSPRFYGYVDFFFVCFFLTHPLLLSWMFEHNRLHTCCFGCLIIYACVLYFCICLCSAQLSIFHMERRSRNTIIIVIIPEVFVCLLAYCLLLFLNLWLHQEDW